MNKKNIKIKNRGETIVEVLVAVVVSVMVLTATFLMLNRAISTNVNVKNRVIALNIAREGIEAVRNIRDTNWLKYSGDRRGKWLCQDTIGVNECQAGGTDDELITWKYKVDYDATNQRYYLIDGTNNTEMDISTATDFSEYQLYYDETTHRYTHDSTGVGATKYQTPFYRQIQLEVHDGDNADHTVPGCTAVPQCQEAKIQKLFH